MNGEVAELYRFLRKNGRTITKKGYDSLLNHRNRHKQTISLADLLKEILSSNSFTEEKRFCIIDENFISLGLQSLPSENASSEKESKLKILSAFGNKERREMTERERNPLRLNDDTFIRKVSNIFIERYNDLTKSIEKMGFLNELRDTQKERLTKIENLPGSVGEKCIFGVLIDAEEGKCFLEDPSGLTELSFENMETKSYGMFSWGSFIAFKGVYEDEIFRVKNLLDLPKQFELKQKTKITKITKITEIKNTENGKLSKIVILSEVHLNDEKTTAALEKLISTFTEDPPSALVLQGNFCNDRNASLSEYKEGFESLAKILTKYENDLRNTEIVVAPGPCDATIKNVLPRVPVSMAVFKSLLKRAGSLKIHRMSSPFYIENLSKKALVFRDDLFSKINKNICLPPEGERKKSSLEELYRDLIWGQKFLTPLHQFVQPLEFQMSSWRTLKITEELNAVFLGDKISSFVVEGADSESAFAGTGMFSVDFSFVVWSCGRGERENNIECVKMK